MGDDLAFTRTAAIKFLNTLTDARRHHRRRLRHRGARRRATARAISPRLVERIRQQKASGFTALYDAIGVYLDGAGGQDGRKIMLLYTDGGDTRSALRPSASCWIC